MSYSKPCAETKKTGYYFSLFSYHPGHPPSPEGSIQFWKKSPLSARNTLFLRKTHGWVFQALQTTRGLYWGWVDHFTTLTEHLPKHQEISLSGKTLTYLSIYEEPKGTWGSLQQREEGKIRRPGGNRHFCLPANPQEAWYWMSDPSLSHFLPTLPLHRSVSFISKICETVHNVNGGEDNSVWKI